MKSSESVLNRLLVGLDFCLSLLAFLLAYFFRSQIFLEQTPLFALSAYVWILFVFLPTLFISLFLFGLYGENKLDRRLTIRLFQAFLICGLVSSAAVFVTRSVAFSRLLFFLFMGIDFLFLFVEKQLIRRFLLLKIRENAGATRVLAVGDMTKATATMEQIRREQDLLFHVAAFLPLTEDAPITADQLRETIIQNTADQVFFFFSKDWVGKAEPYLQVCEELGVTARLLLDWYQLPLSKTKLSYLGNIPALTFHTVSLNQSQLLLKRLMDILGGLVGLILTGVLWLLLAPLIKLSSPGPVFYAQERVGQNGRIFRIYKFRSMVQNADRQLEQLQAQNELKGAVFKIKNDPRVTPVGRVIRKLSLDEFPQFWNVLKGEMSLVGTRPPTVQEVEQYQSYHRRRLSIKPGLTGMWQVSGRNEIHDFEEIYRLDVQYIDHWSLALDIKLLLRTIGTVLSGKGAE